MRISDWSSDVCSSDLAWMDPDALAQWYGPTGLAIENHEADIREGGVWRFDMVGVLEGQQQRFPSLMRFLKVVPNELIVVDYGTPELGRASCRERVCQYVEISVDAGSLKKKKKKK